MPDISVAQISDITYIDDLQRKNAEELSFYPKVVFEREIPVGRIMLARVNGDPVGYLYRGAFGPLLKIHQACIQYDARGYLYGSALVRSLLSQAEMAGCNSVTLRCGSDIAANTFWEVMGFYCQSVSPGGVRRMRDINEWRFDISPQLFTTTTTASDKAQDASLWRKFKDGKKSQFLRGAALREYREKIEKSAREAK